MAIIVQCTSIKLPPNGVVYTNKSNANKIRLAHIVCTYHREQKIIKKNKLFENYDDKDYKMIVVDNGNTIQKSKSAVLLKSDNYGGSAGFARGIIFAMETGFTHILLNDDDAEVNPESIFRLMSFLRLLKDKEICIAGIMFDENNPNIVYESGSSVIRGRLEPYNRGLDLSKIDNIPTIMKENKILYSNWTLFCMPVSVPKNNGLPLPVFVREDDVEYGLRSKMK